MYTHTHTHTTGLIKASPWIEKFRLDASSREEARIKQLQMKNHQRAEEAAKSALPAYNGNKWPADLTTSGKKLARRKRKVKENKRKSVTKKKAAGGGGGNSKGSSKGSSKGNSKGSSKGTKVGPKTSGGESQQANTRKIISNEDNNIKGPTPSTLGTLEK